MYGVAGGCNSHACCRVAGELRVSLLGYLVLYFENFLYLGVSIFGGPLGPGVWVLLGLVRSGRFVDLQMLRTRLLFRRSDVL